MNDKRFLQSFLWRWHCQLIKAGVNAELLLLLLLLTLDKRRLLILLLIIIWIFVSIYIGITSHHIMIFISKKQLLCRKILRIADGWPFLRLLIIMRRHMCFHRFLFGLEYDLFSQRLFVSLQRIIIKIMTHIINVKLAELQFPRLLSNMCR